MVPLTPRYQQGLATIWCADNVQVIQQGLLPEIRTVISDPPYYGMQYAQAVALGLQRFDEAEEAKWLAHLSAWYLEWLPLVRTLVEYATGRAFFFTSPHHFPSFTRMALLSGWKAERVWYAHDAEVLMQFGRPIPDVMAQNITAAFQDSSHPSRIEQAVLDVLIEATDGTVLDPFMGTGGTLQAAIRAGRPCVGIEISAANCDQAIARLDGVCV